MVEMQLPPTLRPPGGIARLSTHRSIKQCRQVYAVCTGWWPPRTRSPRT